ncbi:DegV family protein [Chloroflexota bacterium]
MTIKIVTDSTCDLPEDVIKSLGITVVPIFINIGSKGYLDGVEISRRDFYTNLPNYKVHPTTSAPSIDAFTQVYKKLAQEGASEILSIHISKSLSATLGMAEIASTDFRQAKITVRDSTQLSTGTGFQVETAARMAQNKASMEEILKIMDDLIRRSFVTAKLDTLEYLRRSGRMNAFMTGLGSLLQLKPILTMKNGLAGSEKVRTSKKAEKRLIELLKEYQPIERFALLHTNAPKEAVAFRNRISHLIPSDETYSMDITPVIGAHIGPKAIGFALVSKLPIQDLES